MTLQDLIERLELDATGLASDQLAIELCDVTSDSHKVGEGFLFVGIPGSRIDGATFAGQAKAKGARACVVSSQSELDADLVATGFPVLRVDDVHLTLARLAGLFYPSNLQQVAAVTGTNGKTSIASFLRQIWNSGGRCSANIGTIGIEGPGGSEYGGLTTPDPVGLLQTIGRLEGDGVTHLALEASSHGLEQKRLDGLQVNIGAFTNLTRDHLDYHKSFEAYREAKSQLFSRLIKSDGVAIINLDDAAGEYFLEVARKRGLRCYTLGQTEDADLVIENIAIEGQGQRVTLSGIWGDVHCFVPLVGTFQASNALVAGLMAYASGMDVAEIVKAISGLKGACGRMELVGMARDDAPIYVDYSHTPDSLETVLKALRPFVKSRLIVVFGAGGDRDPGKRPMMGKAANDFANFAVVTDDNPRSEDPALIRAAIMDAVENGIEIGGRQAAIDHAVGIMQEGDLLVVAGKGHEQGQTVAGEILPFSDHEAIRQAIQNVSDGRLVGGEER